MTNQFKYNDWEKEFDKEFNVCFDTNEQASGCKSFIARVIAFEVEKVRREQKEDILKKIPNELLMACFPGGKFTLEWEDGYNCALSDIRSQLALDTELSNPL